MRLKLTENPTAPGAVECPSPCSRLLSFPRAAAMQPSFGAHGRVRSTLIQTIRVQGALTSAAFQGQLACLFLLSKASCED